VTQKWPTREKADRIADQGPWAVLVCTTPRTHLTLTVPLTVAMSFFRRPDYHSEVSHFLDELKAHNPNLEAHQRAGRALLWDQPLEREIWAEYRAGEVAQNAYVYQTQGHSLYKKSDASKS